MRFIVGNISTKIVIGGTDLLKDVDVLEEFRNYFREHPDGYHRTPQYKRKIWDGYRYFITKDNRIPTGLLPNAISLAEDLGLDIRIEDRRGELPKFKEDFKDYIGHIDNNDGRGQIEFRGRPEQIGVVKSVNNTLSGNWGNLYFPRGILDCATNAGKDSIMAMLINNLDKKYRTVIVVSNTEIFNKAVNFFSQVIGEPVGVVCSKSIKLKWLTICMVKTLQNRIATSMAVAMHMDLTEVLIVDESDESSANDYSDCLLKINAGVRVFLTGTAFDSTKIARVVQVGLSGPRLAQLTNQEMIEAGYSQHIIVHMRANVVRNRLGMHRYDGEIEHAVWKSPHRLEAYAQIINEEHKGQPVLIAFNEIAHGQYLYDQLTKMLPYGTKIGLVHGKSKDRDELIQKFRDGEIQVLIASTILKRGVNMAFIRALILAGGLKSERDIKQWVGRLLRHDGTHEEAHLYDFYDWGKWVSKHSAKRITLYKKEGFELDFQYEHRRGKPIVKLY